MRGNVASNRVHSLGMRIASVSQARTSFCMRSPLDRTRHASFGMHTVEQRHELVSSLWHCRAIEAVVFFVLDLVLPQSQYLSFRWLELAQRVRRYRLLQADNRRRDRLPVVCIHVLDLLWINVVRIAVTFSVNSNRPLELVGLGAQLLDGLLQRSCVARELEDAVPSLSVVASRQHAVAQCADASTDFRRLVERNAQRPEVRVLAFRRLEMPSARAVVNSITP